VGISEAVYERMVRAVKAKTTSAVESVLEEKWLHLCNIPEIIRKLIQMLRAYIENILCE
jgi:hypothetical protein